MDKKSNHKYNSDTHLKMLSDATNRIGSNHTAWLIASITSSSLMMTAISVIHFDRFDNITAIILGAFLLMGAISITFTCFGLNLKYFKLEKKFRVMQSKVLNGEYKNLIMNPNSVEVSTRSIWKSWSMVIPFIILLGITVIELIVVLSSLL